MTWLIRIILINVLFDVARTAEKKRKPALVIQINRHGTRFESSPALKTKNRSIRWIGFCQYELVEIRGFEPLTP
jgi:hypothetical protein